MPVREDGKWEDWGTRIAREKAAKVEAQVVAAEAEEPEVKPQRRRRTPSAAQAAIKNATGVTVTIEDPE